MPAANRVGEEGEGFTIAMSAIDQGRYTVAAGSVGLAQACLDASVKYAHERKTFGSEIGEHQLVKQMLAKMYAGIEAGRLAGLQGGLEEEPRRAQHARDGPGQVVRDRPRGGIGPGRDPDPRRLRLHDEYPVERYLRNSKGSVIYEGTSQIHTLIQADYLLGYRKDRELRMPQPAYEGEM